MPPHREYAKEIIMSLIEVSRMDGIRDIIPMMARSLFAKAWLAEYNGEYDKAAEMLDKAVEAESNA